MRPVNPDLTKMNQTWSPSKTIEMISNTKEKENTNNIIERHTFANILILLETYGITPDGFTNSTKATPSLIHNNFTDLNSNSFRN